MMRSKVTGAQRWVVKIGSALLTADGKGLDRAAMGVWVEQMVALHEAGVELVLVSSGAVAAGMSRLGWTARPSAMHELQAAAATLPGSTAGLYTHVGARTVQAAAVAIDIGRIYVEQDI